MPHDALTNSPDEQHCDVLMIGGGPAGSTAATLPAQQGHQVTLLEKAHPPRFHTGESLLPASLPLFEKPGVLDQVGAIGMEKRGRNSSHPGTNIGSASNLPRPGTNPCRGPSSYAGPGSTKF